MKTMSLPKGVAYFVAGLLLALTLVAVTGAGGEAPAVGRYQMEITSRNGFTDIFVIDTATGAIKYVGKDEGKPFDQIHGK
ncbi:MAG: hypothetical protein HY911_12350 [Desulfobacterales bacterium]|nr:hypothetical protein [Desulfobacterales bacterium]